MKNSFLNAQRKGEIGHQTAACELLRAGACLLSGDPGTSSYDSLWSYQYHRFRVEVKTDRRAAQTGNIAIEMWNPRSGIASGLTATHAEFWMTVLANHYVYAARTEAVWLFAHSRPPSRVIDRAGDGNALLWLFPLKEFLLVCRRLDNLSSVGVQSAICSMLELNFWSNE